MVIPMERLESTLVEIEALARRPQSLLAKLPPEKQEIEALQDVQGKSFEDRTFQDVTSSLNSYTVLKARCFCFNSSK